MRNDENLVHPMMTACHLFQEGLADYGILYKLIQENFDDGGNFARAKSITDAIDNSIRLMLRPAMRV